MIEKSKKKLRKSIIKISVFIISFLLILTLTSIKPSALGYGDIFLSHYYEPIINVRDVDNEWHNLDVFVDSIPFTQDLYFDNFVSSNMPLEINTEFTGFATTTNLFRVTPNYRINNIVSITTDSYEISKMQLNYEFITLYDEFIINYYLGDSTRLIPCSVYLDNSNFERVSITYVWTYSKQENGSVVNYTETFTNNHPDLSKPINMLPLDYITDIDGLNEFMNNYGNGQFVKIKNCRVTIDFEPINTEEAYFSALQYSTDFGNYDNNNLLAWYNFDSITSIGDVGTGILNAAESIVQFEILPNFTLLDAILIILAIPLLIWILKVAFGG